MISVYAARCSLRPVGTKPAFVFRAGVPDCRIALPQPHQRFLGGDRFQLVPRAEIRRDNAFHRSHRVLRHSPQSSEQGHDFRLGFLGQSIHNARAVTLRARQARTARLLHMLRGVREAQAKPLGRRFGAARGLRQLPDQLHPAFVPNASAHLG